MKKIFLLSTFVLTQTIFATTLTVYNSNIALIQESHAFTLTQKEDTLVYDNIPNSLIDNSVNITLPPSVTLYSQLYKKKNLTQQEIAKRFIGKNVTIQNATKVKLLTLNGSNALVQDKKGKVFLTKINELIFPYLPKGLQTSNALYFQIAAPKKLHKEVSLSYLAKNINFSSDYILNVSKKKANLQGWIDINNKSGKDFKDTTLQLVAGDIHRETRAYPVMYKSMSVAQQNSAPQLQHKAVASYHSFKLPFTIDLNNNEKRRIKFLEYNNIALENHYIAKMNNPLYLMGERSSSVERELTLKGIKAALPTGIVRIYTQEDGESLFLGEQNIQNTPKNTPLTLKVGKDFDTKVTQKIISRNDTKESFDALVKYTLYNHSQEEKTVTLQIPFNRKTDSKVLSKLKYGFTKGNLVTFTLKLKASSQKSFEVEFISKRK